MNSNITWPLFKIIRNFIGCVWFSLILVGCVNSSSTLKFTENLQPNSETSLKILVTDFNNQTNSSFGELHVVFSDLIASTLSETSFFSSVKRGNKSEYKQNADIVVTGNIEKFSFSTTIHPLAFINPLSLLSIVGAPTGYGIEEGICKFNVVFTDVRTKKAIKHFQIISNYKENDMNSIYTAWLTDETANAVLQKVKLDFKEIIEKNLNGHFRSMLLVLAQPANSSGSNSRIKPLIPHINSNNWAIVIGISDYRYSGQNGLANLIFADDDAKAFARSLRNLGWSSSHIKLLINQEATQRNIMIALRSWLTKAGHNDQVVLFWAGHGYPDPEDPEKVYIATYDTDISIPVTGYRMDEVRNALEEIGSKNVILFADTCHAGKLITRGERGISIMPQINKMQREQKIPKGWVFMVGADTDRQAIEHTSWTNGAFTHSLIKGLNGEADGFQSAGAKDGVVTMGELKDYMNIFMPDETQKVLGIAKRPVITTSTGDPEIWNLTLQVAQ